MKCPHCGYKSEWDNKTLKTIEGEKGDFFRVSNTITMQRKEFHYTDQNEILGCPNCMKLFMK